MLFSCEKASIFDEKQPYFGDFAHFYRKSHSRTPNAIGLLIQE
jgi:hypothetical protein